MAAKKTAAKKTAKTSSTMARAMKAVGDSLKGRTMHLPVPKRAVKVAPKKSIAKLAKKAAKAVAGKPRAPRTSVKKGAVYLDNEPRAGGPRKLVVERIIVEEASPDRWGNERAPRKYAECAVMQNDEPTKRRVKVPVAKLESAELYTLAGGGKSATTSEDDGAVEDD